MCANSEHPFFPEIKQTSMKNILFFFLCLSINAAKSQVIPGLTDPNAFSDLNSKRNDLNIEIPVLEKQIVDIEKLYLSDPQVINRDIERIERDNEFFKKQMETIIATKGPDSMVSSYQYSIDINNSRMQELKNDLEKSKSLMNQKDSLSKVLKEKKFSLIQTENKIAQLMIPKISQQNFMFWSSIAFVILMGFLLGTFFYVVSRDAVIRQTIFGTDSGIQFITLFSIVIAIIIFGLTGILEGKELSALLGAIAGYILGKVRLSGGTPPQNSGSGNQVQ